MTIPIQFRCVLKFSAPPFCFIGTYHHGSLSNLSRYCFFSYLDQVALTNAFSGLKIENINFYHSSFRINQLFCVLISIFIKIFDVFRQYQLTIFRMFFFSARIIQLYDLRRQLFEKLRLKFSTADVGQKISVALLHYLNKLR